MTPSAAGQIGASNYGDASTPTFRSQHPPFRNRDPRVAVEPNPGNSAVHAHVHVQVQVQVHVQAEARIDHVDVDAPGKASPVAAGEAFAGPATSRSALLMLVMFIMLLMLLVESGRSRLLSFPCAGEGTCPKAVLCHVGRVEKRTAAATGTATSADLISGIHSMLGWWSSSTAVAWS